MGCEYEKLQTTDTPAMEYNDVLAIIACAAKNGPTSSRPNVSATVRYLRRAVAIERRAEGDLTGHHFWSNCPRTVAF